MAIESLQAVRRGNTMTWLARILGVDQEPVTQSSWYAPTWELWKKDRGNAIRLSAQQDIDVDECVFDALQTDYGWDTERDPLGYNFRLTISGDYTDDGPKLCVVLRGQDLDNLPFVIQLDFDTIPVP